MSSSPEANESSHPVSGGHEGEFWSRVVDLDSESESDFSGGVLKTSNSHENHTLGFPTGDGTMGVDADGMLSGEFRIRDTSETEGDESRPLPESIGGYRVGRQIGRGGMGEVFLAEHRSMGRTVALKILPARWVNRAGSVNRFYEEIRAASRLMHPNIVTAFDAGESDGIHFLAMEFVDGQTLSAIVGNEGPMSIGDATSAIRQAAFALHHAHAAGIIHRDVKPGNLMRSREGTIKLLDLGLARFSHQWHIRRDEPTDEPTDDQETTTVAAVGSKGFSQKSTRSKLVSKAGSASPESASHASLAPITPRRSLLGTLAFISPEQLEDSESADARSDQYSLGATLFYLLVGHPPYPGETIEQIYGHRHGDVPDLMTYRQDVDLTLANIVSRMLAKSPAERYGSMDEVARAMAPYDNDRSTPAWVLDFSQRKIDEEGSTANDPSLSGESTRHKTLTVLGVDLGMTHAATAVGLPDGRVQAGWPVIGESGPQSLFRMAVAESAKTSKSRADLPSKAVRSSNESNHQVLFGQSAYELRRTHPHRVSHCQLMYLGRLDMMRRLAGRMCPPEVTTALCLRHLIGNTLMNHVLIEKTNAPDAYEVDVTKILSGSRSGSSTETPTGILGVNWQRHESWPDVVAIAVPGCYDQIHRRAIHTAARLAGLTSIRLVNRGLAVARFAIEDEPHVGASVDSSAAARRGDEGDRPSPRKVETMLYVGLTGQALDISIIQKRGNRIEQLASAGHWCHSAIVWTSRLVEEISSQIPDAPPKPTDNKIDRRRLAFATQVQMAGERAMNSLLLLPETKVDIHHNGRTRTIHLNREQWLRSCDDQMIAIEHGIQTACQRAGIEPASLTRCFVQSPILRLPTIRSRVFSKLSPDVPVEFFDYTDAARGAVSCVASELPGHRDGLLPAQSRASHSIGFVVTDHFGKRKIFPIIARGTSIPARTNRQLGGTAVDAQLTLALVESSGLDDESWQTLGRHRITVSPDELTPTRKIGFEVDINGLLSVHLERPDLGRTVRLTSLPEIAVSVDQWEDWRQWVESQA